MTQQNNDTETEVIHTKIWREDPEPDNPFAAAKCYCAGYDVYGEILQKASWSEYLYLLFKQQRPSESDALLLEKIAIAVANPGIRSHSVRAAMCAGVGGSTAASALIAALATGAGNYHGGHEVSQMMQWWSLCETDLSKWKKQFVSPPHIKRAEVWTDMEHAPGFDPHGESCSLPTRQTLDVLEKNSSGKYLPWLKNNRETLEDAADMPLHLTGVVATAFMDLQLQPEQGEILYLLLQLPGAAVHALEQQTNGWRKYPFFGNAVSLLNDPGPKSV